MEKNYEAAEIMRQVGEYRSYKSSIIEEWRLIRSLYKGEFWKVFKRHLKEYSITPDWNYFEYIVQAFSNSVYSGAFIGTLSPRKIADTQKVQDLNAFVRYQWSKWGMKNKFLHIGENGELYNLGAVRVEWINKGPRLKALAPDELLFDPAVDDYREGAALFIERAVNIDTLKLDDDFKEGVEKYVLENSKLLQDKTLQHRIAGPENRTTTTNRTVSLIEAFIRNEDGGIDQVYILDEQTIIFTRYDILPNRFPVVCYSPQRPDGNPYGNSKLNKILNTVVSLNLIDSMEATQPYRLLNRIRFVNVDGRLNMRAFSDYGSTPGATFETKGDPKGIIHYEDVPTIPDQTSLKNRLENSIFQVTGVDPQYKGRMTNSLQTTGATQAFQARVTMLTDNSRIVMLEEFAEDLTKLILENYFEHGGETIYEVPKMSAKGTNAVVDERKINFSELRGSEGSEEEPMFGEDEQPLMDKEGNPMMHAAVEAIPRLEFDYSIAASTLLPMNQANLFESAKALYEMQGQYNFPQEIISASDLVRFSDFPQKDLWLQKIAKQEEEAIGENLIADLTNFATIFSNFLSKGLSEEQAAQQAITVLIEEKNKISEDPTMGRGFQ